MSDFSDNSTVVENRARREPKRLKEMAMMKLVYALSEHALSRISRSDAGIDSACVLDTIKEEALAVSDYIYEKLSLPLADNVQKLIGESIKWLEDEEVCNNHNPILRFLRFLLLHPKSHHLNLELFSNNFLTVDEDMIMNVAELLKSLIFLEHIKWDFRPIDQLAKSLEYCNKLKVFVYTIYCDNEVIKALLQNCPLLSELDISDSERVTDESSHYIKNMKSLTKCSIYKTCITIEGAVRILKNCTELYRLDMSCDICNILEGFEDADDPIQLPLRTVRLNYLITPRHIRLLKKYCPFITHVEVTMGCELDPPQLISVEQLTIHGHWWTGDYVPVFRDSLLHTWLMGDSVTVIYINEVNVYANDFVKLSDMCPNITKLDMVLVYFFNDEYVFSEHRPFQKLKTLKFLRIETGDEPRGFNESDAAIFKILLSYSTMITHVDIENLGIDDRTVHTVFETNQMPYLQYWRTTQTACTSQTFFLLFHKCPMLKYIGELKTWNIHPDEAREIEDYIRKENYDLDTDMSDPYAFLHSVKNKAIDILNVKAPCDCKEIARQLRERNNTPASD